MTAQFKSKIFKAGNSAAVRLPKDVAFELGTDVTIERVGRTVTIRPALDPEAALKRNQELAKRLRAIWADMPDREIGVREPIEAPLRPGLL